MSSNYGKDRVKRLEDMERKIKDQTLTKSLDATLEGIVSKEFFSTFDELSDDMKKKYSVKK